MDFENRPNPRDNVRDDSGLGQFAGIARDNEATISVAPSALLAFVSHSLGLTAQAIIVSALRASSLLHSETGSKADSADLPILQNTRSLIPSARHDRRHNR